jgi:hypothetical protein
VTARRPRPFSRVWLLGEAAAAGAFGSRAISKALGSVFSAQMLRGVVSADPEWADAQAQDRAPARPSIYQRQSIAGRTAERSKSGSFTPHPER